MTNKLSSSSKIAYLWLAFVVACSLLLVKQFALSNTSPIETNILKLLPENRQNPLAEQAFQQIAESMGNKVIFLISANDPKQATRAAESFETKLNHLDLLANVKGRISHDQQSKWAEFYFNHRAQLLTQHQIDTLTVSPESRVQYVLQSLYNPFLGVTSTELSNDPFLLFRDFLSDLTAKSGEFSVVEGFLSKSDNSATHILITAELSGSPYQLSIQQQLPLLLKFESDVEQQFDVEISHTGVIFYADYGTKSAKSEVSTIGLGSLVGVVLLIFIVFRSALPLTLALLSISTGLIVALAVTTAIFGQVHLFSLVFGASLIGVSIDYAFHFLTDRLAAGKTWDSRIGLQHIVIAITLGLITSLIGYLGLLIAPFPGLQQLALFSAIGLFAAYASVVCWYPVLASTPSVSRPLPAMNIWKYWLALWGHKKFSYGFPAIVLLLSTLGLTQLHYDDDIRQLQAMPEHLKAQEHKISHLSGVSNSQQMLLVTSGSEQGLLKKLEMASKQLDVLKDTSTISGFQSISQYLPTIEQQQNNHSLISKLYLNQGELLQTALGWNTKPELNEFSAITIKEFLESPVSEPVRFMWLEPLDGKFASVILLNSINDPTGFKQWLVSDQAASLNLSYLNKSEEISSLFAEYRVNIAELLSLALITIYLVLAWRYGWKHSLKMVLPSCIAGIAALSITVLTGSSLNLFNLLGLILILGIGIDYTLFFSEQKQSYSTLLAITLSAMTTLLSFGLLALSQTHAIHSFGITVLTGIFVAWLLAPLAIQPSSLDDSTQGK